MALNNLRQNLFTNKTPLLIIILVIATVLLVALAISPGKETAPTVNKLAKQAALAETSLSLSELYEKDEEDASESALVSYQTDVQIETGKNKVTGIQLELKYDPLVLTDVDIEPGDFFQNPTVLLKKIDATEGVITYALGAQDSGISGAGTAAIITFSKTGRVSKQTSIEFLSKTAVTAEGFDKTVLKEMNGVEFTSQ